MPADNFYIRQVPGRKSCILHPLQSFQELGVKSALD